MGGLIIKQAYILAKQKQDLFPFCDRVKVIVFLATPHRGSDLARVFSTILSLHGGARPFVEDLHRNSLATQSINEEFPQYCQELKLLSFYETLPTIGKSLIVEQDQATLGYANERRELLNANHRNVCKYSSRDDPNYRTVRNALASIIEDMQGLSTLARQRARDEQNQKLESLLSTYDTPEDDLLGADSLRLGGSCEWLIRRESFQLWLHCQGSPIYWVSANPGTGKTILASKVITTLRQLGRNCSFHFFHYGNKSMSNIASFLLSMIRQMALYNNDVLKLVLDIFNNDARLNRADHRTIWRKMFVEGIFKVKIHQTQYWVVDALDESTNEPEIVALVTKIVEVCEIRILLTSRNQFESSSRSSLLKTPVFTEQITEEDSKCDIALYLEAYMSRLPTVKSDDSQCIITQILDKSAGCFLWVSLVFQDLINVRTLTDIAKVMAEIPSDMNAVYARILSNMSLAQHGKKLAKSILVWTACSIRPLRTSELHGALELDLQDSIDINIEKTVRSSCGQLVYIDAQSQVQMIHMTARDFLLQPDLDSEFAVRKIAGHRELFLTCLAYLNGNEMRSPRRRKNSAATISKQRSPFASYACNSTFEHMAYLSPEEPDTEVISALARFYGSQNVLSWIEYIAANSDLNRLVQTGQALSRYLQRVPSSVLMLTKEASLLTSWATDLVRLAMKFGKDLAASPSVIYELIPPFCPPTTAPFKQFGTSARGISVCGLRARTWDDCLSTILNVHEQYSSLASGQTLFAVGTFRGKIKLYKQTTCQEVGDLDHQEPVRLLMFGNVRNMLVSAGSKVTCVWDLNSKERLWRLDTAQQSLSLTLTEGDRVLLSALKDHRLRSWDLDCGSLTDSVDWTQGLEEMARLLYRRPITAAFGMDASLLAVIYKGQDILLWDLESNSLYDTYSRENGAGSTVGRPYGSAGVRCLCFGCAETADLLAAAYGDGELVLFDTSMGTIRSSKGAFAHVLICSANGSTLASADPAGTIQLFKFNSLELLYRINSVEPGIQDLAFSGDGLRLLDIRGSRCRVWEPTALVGQQVNEESTDTTSTYATAPEVVSLESVEDVILITSVVCHNDGRWLFCGKEDGSVYLYENSTGSQSKKLFSHAHGVAIVHLDYEVESQTLSSIDSSSRIMIHQLIWQGQTLDAQNVLFEYRASTAIAQIICNKGLSRILICSARDDSLWSISEKENNFVNSISYDEREPYRWAKHPLNPHHLILIRKNTAHVYDWDTLDRITGLEGILLEGSILPELAIRSIVPCFSGSVLATTFSESLAPQSESKLILWNSSDFQPNSESAAPVPNYHHLADHVEVLIGSIASTNAPSSDRLIFLHKSNWVCAADSATAKADMYIPHFFFPADWLSPNAESIIEVTSKGDIVLVKRDEIAIIKRGLLTK